VRVFAALIDLHCLGCQSLKDKRHVVKGLIESIRHKMNVSVSEVDYHDTWQRAKIGIAWISHDGVGAETYYSEIIRMIDSRAGLERISVERLEY